MKLIYTFSICFLCSVASLSIEDRTEISPRNKRSIGQLNKSYQECRTPNGSAGHCKQIQHCSLSEFQQNLASLLGYMCIIEQSTIGVCCPDEFTDRMGSSIGTYPQRGDELPEWNEIPMGKDGSTAPKMMRPEERGCGLSTKSFPKIVGGRPADPKEWPWMAALILRGVPKAHCGSVLITDRHVLTAAHCIYVYTKNEITVRLGEYRFSTKEDTRSRDFRVIDFKQHEEFDETTYENDVAILKLHQTVLFNSYIWPVCMPPTGDTFDGYDGIVTGWGTQSFGGPASDVLMEVSMPIWKNDNCQERFIERIGESVLCAGAKEGGKDSCQGDSGGPLLVQLPNKRWVTVGIVSWGIRCGEKNRPGVYTRVSHYMPWIMLNAVF